MSKFHELNKNLIPWREQWIADSRRHQSLPRGLAEGFRNYLGAPDSFGSDGPHSISPTTKYILPTRAIWNDEKQNFNLIIHDSMFTELDFRDDGHFYFGMRIFLEIASNTYPKQDFWILLNAKFHGDFFNVKVMPGEKVFRVDDLINDESNKLFESLIDALKKQMSISPLRREFREKYEIVFVTSASTENTVNDTKII